VLFAARFGYGFHRPVFALPKPSQLLLSVIAFLIVSGAEASAGETFFSLREAFSRREKLYQ